MLLDLQGLKIALNGISTKIDSKISKNQLPKPDWNESNPASKNFIQNKTHGEKIKTKYLLKDETFSKVHYDSCYINGDIELDPSKTYIVNYDDIPYTLKPMPSIYGDYFLGNEHYALYNNFDNKDFDNYIPFCIPGNWMYIDDINPHTIEIIVLNDDDSSEVLVEKTHIWFHESYYSSIPLSFSSSYKIEYDDKIYDNITISENNLDFSTDYFSAYIDPTGSYLSIALFYPGQHKFKFYQDGELIIDEIYGYHLYMELPSTFSPIGGQEYDVIWNNELYSLIAKEAPYSYEGDTFYLGNLAYQSNMEDCPDTGEPFLIEIYNGETIYVSGNDNIIPFSISEKYKEIQQLDPKFIPGALGVVDYEGSVSFGTGKTGGTYSFAAGCETRASGDYSFAVGDNTEAGPYSCAVGQNTRATYCSHAEGYYTEATGGYTHAEGSETKASGMYSHAEGSVTEASGMFSHAEGNYTTASNQAAHAEGCSTVADGTYSHAEGFNSKASGEQSHAEGFDTEANNSFAHAENYRTIASGSMSHAEGGTTIASGTMSHAEGNSTKASGSSSHAEGGATEAIGENSHAEGHYTVATGSSQHVQGEWNVPDQNTSTPGRTLHAHIVGNGTGTDARSNAHTLDWDGNAWFAGDVYVGSASGVNRDSGSKKLATEEYVDTSIANLVDSAPDTLNTLNELATAIQENDNVIDTLNAAITNKVTVPQNAVAGDLLTYDGTNWVRISKADLIAEIIAALPRAEEATF